MTIIWIQYKQVFVRNTHFSPSILSNYLNIFINILKYSLSKYHRKRKLKHVKEEPMNL